MTNHENLPVWARILIGIPVRDEASEGSQSNQPAANCQQAPVVLEHQHQTQSVLVFDPTASKRKCGWRGLTCPVPGKLQS